MSLAYDLGRAQAEREFGVRVALDHSANGAELLASRLSALGQPAQHERDDKTKKLERPVGWSGKMSPYATGAASHDYSGIGPDGAAI